MVGKEILERMDDVARVGNLGFLPPRAPSEIPYIHHLFASLQAVRSRY